jgi:hypothetical protein
MKSLALIWLIGMLSWLGWWGVFSLGKAVCNLKRINLRFWASELGFGAVLINVVFLLLVLAIYLRVPANVLPVYSVLLVAGIAVPTMHFRRKLLAQRQ